MQNSLQGLLNEFQQSYKGDEFVDDLRSFMEDMIARDPTLLNSNTLYDQIHKEIEESYIYQSLREQALDELQEDYYKKKIIDQIEITKKNDT